MKQVCMIAVLLAGNTVQYDHMTVYHDVTPPRNYSSSVQNYLNLRSLLHLYMRATRGFDKSDSGTTSWQHRII